MGSIPGSGRSLGVGNGNPLQYSCLGNPMDRGAWRATVHGVTKKSDTTEHTYTRIELYSSEFRCREQNPLYLIQGGRERFEDSMVRGQVEE